MRPTIHLTTMPEETHFAPLGVFGYCLTRTRFLEPVLKSVRFPLKTVAHSPASKLLDVLVSILAGCRAIRQVNTRLRPDLALAQAWGRERFAEQATLARTLDCFTAEQITPLRQGTESLFRRESRTLRHPFADDWLWLDIDLTPPCRPRNTLRPAPRVSSGRKKPLWAATGTSAGTTVSRNTIFPALPGQTSEQSHLPAGRAGH